MIKTLLVSIIRKILLVLSYLFPVKENRILCYSYAGQQYSCNPKYFTEYLLQKTSTFDIVWAFYKPSTFEKLVNPKIKCIKYKSLKFLYYMFTSKIIIMNVTDWKIAVYKKKQIIINTWHGGGDYKRVGKYRKTNTENDWRIQVSTYRHVNYFLSSSEVFSNNTLRESFLYRNTILPFGMPRNDLLFFDDEKFKNKIRDKIFSKYKIKSNMKIVLYAPTYREQLVNYEELNIADLLMALSKKFNGSFILLYRTHYNSKTKEYSNVVDVTKYPDMQELLYITDVLITDYSSSIWDYSFTYKPCFLYTPDLNEYLNDRNFYSPIDSWPYPYAKTNGELINVIINYDSKISFNKIVNHHKKVGNYENGFASKQLYEFIKKKVEEEC